MLCTFNIQADKFNRKTNVVYTIFNKYLENLNFNLIKTRMAFILIIKKTEVYIRLL
jgi:hypothetical protein